MYVVLRQADVPGPADTLAMFEDESEADLLAEFMDRHDKGAYETWVEFTPVETSARETFREILKSRNCLDEYDEIVKAVAS